VRVHFYFVIVVAPLVLFLPETHGPTILKRRAQKMRDAGITNAYSFGELHALTPMQLMWSNIGRPAVMLATEPLQQGAGAWITVAYSLIYLYFEVFPIVFIEQNHIPYQLAGLPFLGITVGLTLGILCTPLMLRAARNVRFPFFEPPEGVPINSPEFPLKSIVFACLMMPIGLFWFAWTSGGNVHWIVPTLAGIPFGYSMISVFYIFSAYMTQTYSIYASSAQAANTFVRSIFAAICPVIAHPIIDPLGTRWGVSLFGFLSLGLLPIPLLFIRYGAQLREKSRHAREAREIIARMTAGSKQSGSNATVAIQQPETDEKRSVKGDQKGPSKDLESQRTSVTEEAVVTMAAADVNAPTVV